MRALDFILQTRSDLQEKGEGHWRDEEMLVKLQRAYKELQRDYPYFRQKESLGILKAEQVYRLDLEPLKNVRLSIDGRKVNYVNPDYLDAEAERLAYTFEGHYLRLGFLPAADGDGEIVYRGLKEIETLNCVLELPSSYDESLSMLFKSKLYEKPPGNSKQRDLNAFYLRLYQQKLKDLRHGGAARPVGLTMQYKRV